MRRNRTIRINYFVPIIATICFVLLFITLWLINKQYNFDYRYFIVTLIGGVLIGLLGTYLLLIAFKVNKADQITFFLEKILFDAIFYLIIYIAFVCKAFIGFTAGYLAFGISNLLSIILATVIVNETKLDLTKISSKNM